MIGLLAARIVRGIGGAAALAMAVSAGAQTATATLRGNITSQVEPAGGASVAATNIATGYVVRTTANAAGDYVLSALPAGSYRIVVRTAGTAQATQLITLRVGQNVSLNMTLDELSPLQLDPVLIAGARSNRTPEVGTNVTPKQMEALPQTTRNFLSFADLAPGVVFTTSPDGSTQIRGGAQPSAATNVYIDGVGQKNNVLQGGITGQDSSRGNPFPQSAIAEYKVLTQNYKAEFDQVSSAAVVAATKSGTNEFHGDLFWDHSATGWRAATPAERSAGHKTPSKENQFGVSLGGPVIKDRMHWFLAYEGKSIDTPQTVSVGQGRNVSDLPTPLQGLAGSANAPFREDLLFGKLDWSIDDRNLVELSVKLRDESEIANVGGRNTLPWSTDKGNSETRIDLRYQRSADNWVNDTHLTFEDAYIRRRPHTIGPGTVLTTADPGQIVLNAGGGRDFQNKGQKGFALQDDLTLSGLDWKGSHVVKLGAKLKLVRVDAQDQTPFNPQYFYDIGESTTTPYQVQFGVPLAGEGRARSNNTQVGLYAQDDWEVNKNITLNAGLRWDYERSPAYLNYVTPPDVVAALRSTTGLNAPRSGIDIDDYISSGGNRKTFTGAWQPRVGFSLDLDANEQHVVFGGLARAYDRNLFDYPQLETTRASYPGYTYFFNTPAHPCSGANCKTWDPAFLDATTLRAQAGTTGAGREIDLLNNKLKPPRSDQATLGMRNRIGQWNTEVAYSHVQSRDGFVYLLGNRRPDGSFFASGSVWNPPYGFPVPGFGSLILGTNGLATRSNALFVKADRPYTIESGWGAGLAYSYTNAKENRQFGEHYALDYPSLANYGWKPAGGVSRHRIVATGILDGPMGLVFGARLTLATQAPRYGLNCLNSAPDNSGCFIDQITPSGGRFLVGGPVWGYRQFDLAASKDFKVTGGTMRLRADLLNVLNFKNYFGYDTYTGLRGTPNANFGRPDGSLAGPPRTLKVGLAYAW
jgi:outer membrane receptor protein involved in Fe transport